MGALGGGWSGSAQMDGLKDLGDKMTKHRYGHCLGADSGSILTHLKLGWKKVLEGELPAKDHRL